MKTFQTVLLVSFVMLQTMTCVAATYYISPSGLNTSAGTQSQPWQTIQKGADVAQPGDTVFVQPGIYRERVKIKNAGAPGAQITFRAAPAVTNWGFYIPKSFITIDGFEIVDNTNTVSWEGAIDITRQLDTIKLVNNKIHDFDPLRSTTYGIHFGYASNAVTATRNVTITNNILRNLSGVMLHLTCSNVLVADNILDFANTHDAIHAFGAEIRICDNLFTNISKNPAVADHTDIIQTYGDDPSESYNLTFERNFIVNCESQLCQLEQKGRNIRNWTFRNNVWVNLVMGGNIDIENCNWYNNTFFRCTQSTAGPLLLNNNIKGSASNAAFATAYINKDIVGGQVQLLQNPRNYPVWKRCVMHAPFGNRINISSCRNSQSVFGYEANAFLPQQLRRSRFS